MKKKRLASLAILGISFGLLTASCNKAKGQDNMSPEMKTFYQQLSPNAQQKFLQLDDEHRRMAMEILQHGCKGENACKGHRESAVEQQYHNQIQQRQQMNGNMRNH